MHNTYTYTQKGECETKRLSSLTKPSENPLFKGILECEGCFESLTQLSHSALFVVNMYAITAVWC